MVTTTTEQMREHDHETMSEPIVLSTGTALRDSGVDLQKFGHEPDGQRRRRDVVMRLVGAPRGERARSTCRDIRCKARPRELLGTPLQATGAWIGASPQPRSWASDDRADATVGVLALVRASGRWPELTRSRSTTRSAAFGGGLSIKIHRHV